jgi:hypothetical protein
VASVSCCCRGLCLCRKTLLQGPRRIKKAGVVIYFFGLMGHEGEGPLGADSDEENCDGDKSRSTVAVACFPGFLIGSRTMCWQLHNVI